VKKVDSLSELWSTILTELEKAIPEVVIKTWISHLEPVSFDGETLVLKVDAFKKNVIQNKFLNDIKIAVEKSIGFSAEIILETEEESIIKASAESNGSKDFELTFEKFIVAPSNKFAYIAANTVAQKPGSVHNPLFIYGKSGLGKTHLLKAIYHELSSNRPELNILYTNGESFMNEMIAHISEKNMREFHNKFRTPDVLLVDDIQFIENKPTVQEEFFYTFEELISRGKQIVISSDKPPKDIKSLEERLSSRFLAGLLADIQPPEIETRIAIIKKKAQLLDMEMPDDVVKFIAEKLKNNVRQLEGVVKKIYAIYSINNKIPTIALANDVIKDVIYYAQPTEVTIKNIIEEVSKSFGVTAEDIKSNKKKAEIVNARQFAMYIMREVTNLTLDEIGNQFGNKKHSTVLYSCEAVEEKIAESSQLDAMVSDIIKNVKEE
jgi:chromosomal replication initiator protein